MPSSSRPGRSSLGAVADGWRRVAGFPTGLLAVWVAVAAAALPGALAVRAALERQLGASQLASAVAGGVELDWWHEFSQRGAPASFRLSIIGGAGPVSTYSGLLDGEGPPAGLGAAILAAGLAWLFLSGGILDRYARRRRVGARGFFGTCGVFFFRFVRLALMTALAYALMAGPVHAWLFDVVYPWVTRDTTVERTAFLWRVAFYVIWIVPLLLVNVTADYAKVRAVLEDRHSMMGAILSALRFIRRHPTDVAAVYAVNAALAGVVLLVYLLLAPDGRGGDWRLLAVLAIGAAYLVARLATRLAFLASAMALVERRFAHAEYTAQPLPVWPDSPAAEAIENLRSAEFEVRSAR
jgi:hypothetical protein